MTLADSAKRMHGEATAVLAGIRENSDAIRRAAAHLERLPADCPHAPQIADLLSFIAAQQQLSVSEAILAGAKAAAAWEAAEAARSGLAFGALMDRAAYLEGRRDEAREQQEAAQRARVSRPRHARPRFTVVKGAAAAGIVAVASAGSAAVLHDSASSVRYVASGPAHHSVLHLSAPDPAAVPLRTSWSPSARPSVAVKSARPAPSVTVSPASSPAPAPSPSSSAPPVTAPAPLLDVPPVLDFGAVDKGTLTLNAEGSEPVTWTAATTDGVTLNGSSQAGGVIVPGQPVTLQVDAPQGFGWVYFSAGDQSWAVEITSAVGSPVPAGA